MSSSQASASDKKPEHVCCLGLLYMSRSIAAQGGTPVCLGVKQVKQGDLPSTYEELGPRTRDFQYYAFGYSTYPMALASSNRGSAGASSSSGGSGSGEASSCASTRELEGPQTASGMVLPYCEGIEVAVMEEYEHEPQRLPVPGPSARATPATGASTRDAAPAAAAVERQVPQPLEQAELLAQQLAQHRARWQQWRAERSQQAQQQRTTGSSQHPMQGGSSDVPSGSSSGSNSGGNSGPTEPKPQPPYSARLMATAVRNLEAMQRTLQNGGPLRVPHEALEFDKMGERLLAAAQRNLARISTAGELVGALLYTGASQLLERSGTSGAAEPSGRGKRPSDGSSSKDPQ